MKQLTAAIFLSLILAAPAQARTCKQPTDPDAPLECELQSFVDWLTSYLWRTP